MRRSKIRAFVHIVWATYERMPLVSPEIEGRLYRYIQSELQDAGCDVLALNGMPDDIHVVASLPATITFAAFAKQAKAPASLFARKELLPPDSFFRWQAGYGLFTLSGNHVRSAVAYVQAQKEHHTSGTLWPAWEETDEPAPITP